MAVTVMRAVGLSPAWGHVFPAVPQTHSSDPSALCKQHSIPVGSPSQCCPLQGVASQLQRGNLPPRMWVCRVCIPISGAGKPQDCSYPFLQAWTPLSGCLPQPAWDDCKLRVQGGSALCAVPCTPGTHPAGASEGLIQSCEGLCGGLIKLLSPSCACPINQRCWLGKLGHGELPNPGDPPGAHQMPVPPARHLRHPRTAAQRPGRGWRVGMGTAGGDGSVAGHGRAGVLGRGWGGVVAMALRG